MDGGISKIEEKDEFSHRSDTKKNSRKLSIKEEPIQPNRPRLGTATFADIRKQSDDLPIQPNRPRLGTGTFSDMRKQSDDFILDSQTNLQERKNSIAVDLPLKNLDMSADQISQSNRPIKAGFLPRINAEKGSMTAAHHLSQSPTKSFINGSFTVPHKARRRNISMDDSARNSDNLSTVSGFTKNVGRFSRLISNKDLKLTKALALVRKNLFDKVQKCNFNGVLKILIELIQIAIDEDNIRLFLLGVEQIGDIYFFFNKNEDAFTIYNQLRLASEFAGDYVRKCDAMMKIAECCKNLAMYEPALVFLKKSLQYAWDTCKEGREIKIYDALGSIHFHLGDIQRAAAYHEKSVKGLLEPFTSPTRDTYRMLLESHKTRYIKTSHVDNSFLAKLSIPFPLRNARSTQRKNSIFMQPIPSQESSLTTERSDDNSNTNNVTNVNSLESIEKKKNREDYKPSLRLQIELIQKEPEFEIGLPSPRENVASNHIFAINARALRLFELKKEQAIKMLQKKPALPKVELKKTLDQKFEELMKFEFDANQMFSNIKKGAKKDSYNTGLNETLVLNHLKTQKSGQDTLILFQKCFKNFEKAYKKFLKYLAKKKR